MPTSDDEVDWQNFLEYAPGLAETLDRKICRLLPEPLHEEFRHAVGSAFIEGVIVGYHEPAISLGIMMNLEEYDRDS